MSTKPNPTRSHALRGNADQTEHNTAALPRGAWEREGRDLKPLAEQIFHPTGLLNQLYGFEYREQQHHYALAVCDWLTGDQPAVAMLEGETGIGKSLAYLLPLAIQLSLTGQRALISTYTVHLIQQLGRDRTLITELLSHLGLRPITVCNRLGRAQYVSASKVLELADSTESPRERRALLQWYEKIKKSYGPHVYLNWWYENTATNMSYIKEGREIYLGLTEHCSPDDAAWYLADCEQANHADLVLTSHTVTMLATRNIALFDTGEKPFHYLIADEADRLPDAAESLTRLRSSPQRIASLCRELKDACGWPAQQINTACSALKEMQTVVDDAGGLYRDQPCLLSRNLPASLGASYTTAVKRSLAALKPLVDSIQPTIEASFTKLNTLKGFYQSLNSILTDEHQPSCLAWSPVNRIGSVAIDNPFAALAFSRWVRGIGETQPPVSVLLTSGTLGISAQQGPARFAPLRAMLGINEADLNQAACQRYAPRHYGDIRFVLAGEVARPFHGDADNEEEQATYNPQWLAFAARMLTAAMAEGSTLCLCPSFAEVAELQAIFAEKTTVESATEPKAGFHLKGTRLDELIEQLQAGTITAIVTPSAWEGVSIRTKEGKQLLTNIMVTRIPIQPPSRVTENAFAARYVSSGRTTDEAKKVLYGRVRDRGLRKLRQGLIGRGIRNSQDSVTAWVADPRIGPDRRFRLQGVIPERFYPLYEQAEYFQVDGTRLQGTEKEEVIWL